MPIIHDANEVRLCGEELRPVIWQGRQWAVTTFGIESRDGLYAIRARRLTEGLRDDDPHCWIDLRPARNGSISRTSRPPSSSPAPCIAFASKRPTLTSSKSVSRSA
jgi:hypothetical protein